MPGVSPRRMRSASKCRRRCSPAPTSRMQERDGHHETSPPQISAPGRGRCHAAGRLTLCLGARLFGAAVRIVVGFPAGGGSDIQARLMGQWLCSQRRVAAEDRAAESDDLIKGYFAFVEPDPCATQGRILQFGGARGGTPRKAGGLAGLSYPLLLAIVLAAKGVPRHITGAGIVLRSDALPNGCVYRDWFSIRSFAQETKPFHRGSVGKRSHNFSLPTFWLASLKSVLRQTGTGNARRPRLLPLGYASTVRRQSVPIRPCGCPECRGRSHASADAQ